MVSPAEDWWSQFESADSNNPNQNDQSNVPEEVSEDEGSLLDTVNQIEEPEKEEFQWGNYLTPETYQGEPDPTEDENGVGYFIRNIASNASRVGEQVLGKVGNLEKMGKDILSNFPQYGGLLGWGIQKLIGQERWERMVRGQPGREQMYPTSEQLKEFSNKATGGYTAPKTKGEENFQKYIEDIGSTIGPGRTFNVRNMAVNNLGIPVASNVVQDVVEGLGFGKDKGTIGKLLTWTGLSLLGNINAPKYASEMMNQGRNGIPQAANFDTPRMLKRLDAVDKKLLSADPRTALARQTSASIRSDISNGQNSVRSLMTSYDGINAAKRNRGLFELSKGDREYAKRAINDVLHEVRNEIVDAGKNYPEALKSWRDGIQAWAVIHQSKSLTNTIDNWARGPYAKVLGGPAAALFGVGAYGGLKNPLIAGPAAVGVPAAYKTLQTAYRVWEDPRLSKYYWNAILEAQRENAPAFINNYNKLNKSLEESSGSSKKNKKKS